MRSMFAALSAERIAGFTRDCATGVAIEVVAETGSTNADLLVRVANLSAPVLRVAGMQTAGRGRAGRVWHAAPDAALTFSLAWCLERPLQELVGLPLAVGVAVAETLAGFGVMTTVKWPNDVLKDGAKLAGILIETAPARAASKRGVWAVIGIGINLAQPAAFAAQIGRPVANAPSLLPDRNRVLAELLNSLSTALVQFEQEGLAAFVERWNRLHAYAGQQVVILDQDRVVQQGTALGTDELGRLLLDTTAGPVAIVAGDVSLRTLEG